MKGPTMALPDLVLVHGGEHAGDCWDLVVAELRGREPELRTLTRISSPEGRIVTRIDSPIGVTWTTCAMS